MTSRPDPDKTSTDQEKTTGHSRLALAVYVLMSIGLLCYVGLLTGNRAEKLDADAWEHHRAVLAMSQDMWEPGNPTYASDAPTIRYSPYTIGLAWISRTFSVDAYDALSMAAVFNTLLLVIALWWWLRGYKLEAAAPLVLLSLIFLYGYPPGYANSFALSDLPWHQVNPSAMAMSLMIFAWGWLVRVHGVGLIPFTIVAAVLIYLSVLSHGMSGVMGAFGLFITAIGSDSDRIKRAVAAIIAGLIAFGLALTWPWYDFLFAVTHSPDKWYWFNPAIFKMMLLIWCLPAMLAVLATLPYRGQPFFRTALLATLGLLCIAGAGSVAGSPTLARIPLAGLIFPQAAVGVFLYKIGVISPATWWHRIKQLFSRDRGVMNTALVECVVAGLVVAFAIPNLWLTLSEPHLARKWIASALGKEDKQPHNWQRYDAILTPNIGPDDVVLAEPLVGWPVPSFDGRIVSALHLEFDFDDLKQFERMQDTERFFSPATNKANRIAIIKAYDVKWILLDRQVTPGLVLEQIMTDNAVVQADDQLVLIDAHAWADSDTSKTDQAPDSP